MLTLLTPFFLGIIVQFSAIISAWMTAPRNNNTLAAEIAEDEFAYRLDRAVFPPSAIILLSSALLNRGRLSEEVVTLIVSTAIVVLLLGQLLLVRTTPTSYASLTRKLFGITALNGVVLVANVVLGLVTAVTASPAEHKEAAGPTAVWSWDPTQVAAQTQSP